jgi:hypothetical protein
VSLKLTASDLTAENLLTTLPEARNRVYARHYGRIRDTRASRRRPRS